MTPCPCSYTLLETVKTVEAKLRLNVGAGNESLTQEKPPPPSSARAQIRKELLPDFFLTPSPPTLNTEINMQDSCVPRSTHSPSPSALTWHFLCPVSCSFFFLMQCG